jgi:hypothetical protein
MQAVEAAVLEQQRDGLISPEGARAELRRLASERRFAANEIAELEQQRATFEQQRAASHELGEQLEQLRAGLEGATFAERRRILELLVPGFGAFVLRIFDGKAEVTARRAVEAAQVLGVLHTV